MFNGQSNCILLVGSLWYGSYIHGTGKEVGISAIENVRMLVTYVTVRV
jgi:hypothetical protein